MQTVQMPANDENIPSPAKENNVQTPAEENEKGDNYTLFRGEVYAGNYAYPLEGAKVELMRDNELIAYLSTNNIGQTKTIKIPSPPKQNSLEPYNTDKSTNYFANVYADGFVTKKNVLVSAVGDTFALLQENMTPVSEEVS